MLAVSLLLLPFGSDVPNNFWAKLTFKPIYNTAQLYKWALSHGKNGHISLWEETAARYTEIKWLHWVAHKVLEHKYLEKRFIFFLGGVVVENFDILNSLKQYLSNENTILKPEYLLSRQDKQYITAHWGDTLWLLYSPLPFFTAEHIFPLLCSQRRFKEISVFQ